MKTISLVIVILILFYKDYSEKPMKTFQNANCFIDTTINNITLLKDLSPVFGDIESSFINCEPDCRMTVYNIDTTEMLELFFYPGRLKNECSYFKISKCTPTKNKEIKIIKNKSFITGNGIKLFDNYNKIISYFKGLHIIEKTIDNTTTVTYFGDMQEKSKCSYNSGKYDFSLYMSKYTFKQNKLISFEFGFVYP